MAKTEEEERAKLLRTIKDELLKQGKGKDGKNAALKLLLELEGFTQKDGKELFELTADDYHLIEQQAQRELDNEIPSNLSGEGEVQEESDLLLDSLHVVTGSLDTTKDYQMEAVDISDIPD